MSNNQDRAYWRLDAESKIRKESMDFAIRIGKILPKSYKKPISVLDFARLIEGFIASQMREDIDKLPSDIVEGLREKYGDKKSYEDLL